MAFLYLIYSFQRQYRFALVQIGIDTSIDPQSNELRADIICDRGSGTMQQNGTMRSSVCSGRYFKKKSLNDLIFQYAGI